MANFPDNILHVNQALGDFATGYTPPEEWWTWRKILPVKTVNHKSDFYRNINRSNLMRRQSGKVGAGATRFNRLNFFTDPNGLYVAMDYVQEVVVPETDRKNADAVLQYDQEQIKVLVTAMNIDWQVGVQKEVLRGGAIPTIALTGGDRFDADSPTSDPIDILRAACDDVQTETGHRPNHVELYIKTWRAMQNNPRVLARAPVHPTGEGVFTKKMLAEALEIEESAIVISNFWYNVAEENQPEDKRTPLGPDVIVLYNEEPSPRHYGLGITFMWDGGGVNEFQKVTDPALTSPIMIYNFVDYYADARGGYVYRGVGSLDFKITNPKAGKIIQTAINPLDVAKYGTIVDN